VERKEWILVHGKTAKKVEGNLVATEVGDKLYMDRFTCVPDTIDPRGPKGK
jgi:hypothetical protein